MSHKQVRADLETMACALMEGNPEVKNVFFVACMGLELGQDNTIIAMNGRADQQLGEVSGLIAQGIITMLDSFGVELTNENMKAFTIEFAKQLRVVRDAQH